MQRTETNQAITAALNEHAAAYNDFMNALCPPLPSPLRGITCIVVSLAITALGLVAGCTLATWLALLAYSAGLWAFLAAVLEVFLMMLAGIASAYAGSAVARWIYAGKFADTVDNAWGWIKGKFTRDAAITPVTLH